MRPRIDCARTALSPTRRELPPRHERATLTLAPIEERPDASLDLPASSAQPTGFHWMTMSQNALDPGVTEAVLTAPQIEQPEPVVRVHA